MLMAYGTIIAGSLVYISDGRTPQDLQLVFGLLLLFSSLWLLASLRLRALLNEHYDRLKDISSRLGKIAYQPLVREWATAPKA